MSAPTQARWRLSMGPDREPTRAEVVEHAHATGHGPGRTQYPAGHLLGTCQATIYGRVGATAAELRACAATALAMAAVLEADHDG